jgi:hypothetical protein
VALRRRNRPRLIWRLFDGSGGRERVMSDTPDDYHDHYNDDDDDYDLDDEPFDCHMRPDGQCGAAGSEECDFECPIMVAIHREEMAARKASGGDDDGT